MASARNEQDNGDSSRPSRHISRKTQVACLVSAAAVGGVALAVPTHPFASKSPAASGKSMKAAVANGKTGFKGCDPLKGSGVSAQGASEPYSPSSPYPSSVSSQATALASNIANLQSYNMLAQYQFGEIPPKGRAGVGDVLNPMITWFSSPTPSNTEMTIRVFLGTRDLQGMYQSVIDRSTPNSPSYRCFLTPAEYTQQFAATDKQVQTVVDWAKQYGLSLVDKPSNNLYVTLKGTAGDIGQAFQTTLWDYEFANGDGTNGIFRFVAPQATVPVRFNKGQIGNYDNLILTVSGIEDVVDAKGKPHKNVHNLADLPKLLSQVDPKAVEAKLGGRVNFDQYLKLSPAKQQQLRDGVVRMINSRFAHSTAHIDGTTPGAPPEKAFPSPVHCSPYWGANKSGLPKFSGQELAWSNCGYVPSQLRAANGDNSLIAQGIDGKGKTFAIIDAFADPYLAKNQAEYRARHGEAPLQPGQLRDLSSQSLRHLNNHVCQASGWAGEENLDFVAGWTYAPAATGEYVGAQSCNDGDLIAAENVPVAAGNVDAISNSWGGVNEPTDPGLIQAYEQVFAQAAMEGISVFFSAGDGGNSLTDAGYPTADYPASDPLVSAVGGVAQMIGKHNQMLGQVGWGDTAIPFQNNTWQTPGTWQYGGGGGPSWTFGQAWYEQGKVPGDLGNNPYALNQLWMTNGDPVHVAPALAQDADPITGELIPETVVKANGKVGYVEFPIGGTSLASPLQVGLQVAADQAHGDYGFVNPAVYNLPKQAMHDIVPAQHPWVVARILPANYADTSDGYNIVAKELDQLDPWQYSWALLGLPSDVNHSAFDLSTRSGYDNVTGNGVPDAAKYVEYLGRSLGD